ncbi:MAG: YbaK/EbsC family protein [Caldilineaceae bacterium]
MAFANNATRLLDSRKVAYVVHEYDYDSGVHSAVDVAEAVGLRENQVFKTLVALPDQPNAKPVLAIIAGPDTLDLKLLAKALNVKKARMASHAQAEELTGLQTGGISALALMNRGFRVFIDVKALESPTIAVSAGQRGVNLELAPDDLIKVTKARVVELVG